MSTIAPVQAPSDLTEFIQANPRSQAIDQHGFDLNLKYWNSHIGHLPGVPVRGIGGDTERGRVSRGSLFAMADPACEDESYEAAYALLWHTLAWGTGSSHRNTKQGIASVEQDVSGIGSALRLAASLSRTDPEADFRTLQPNRPLIKSLGPNFFTKYLYFAGAGNPEHRCLIVDNRVLATLSRYTEEPLTPKHGSGYGYKTYSTAIELMVDWATQLSTTDRQVGFDEIERWAFAAR
ncbi:8-oxoguanine DNA glycosylase OGG fold protein [Arthrobacter glacialis]|uniref:Uncharacterized protein n=1 Tax=Arthrobacter glacialis TaxID=1664 RepID=A0A2S3ZW17_ARTGL|nr:hypothetical protein [Arthrobacter glacialis]POH73455.1 hypothetical protein CVS27_11145 [Arthrobacter glacialis]